MYVSPSSWKKKFSSQWKDFHEIWYQMISQKYVDKIKVFLKHDKNIGYFTLRPMYIYDNNLLNYPKNEKYFRHNLQSTSKRTFYTPSFFPPSHAVY